MTKNTASVYYKYQSVHVVFGKCRLFRHKHTVCVCTLQFLEAEVCGAGARTSIFCETRSGLLSVKHRCSHSNCSRHNGMGHSIFFAQWRFQTQDKAASYWPSDVNSSVLVILCLVWILLLKKNSRRNLLPPRSRVLLEKLTGFHLIKKFTAFTSARHVFPSWASSI
jgi:hypothetical protein